MKEKKRCLKKIIVLVVIFITTFRPFINVFALYYLENIEDDFILREVSPYLADINNPTEEQIIEAAKKDTENIQKAINDETDGKKLIVKLAQGNYYINKGIRVENNNIKIEGTRSEDENETVFVLCDNGKYTADNAILISSLYGSRENIEISNITIEGCICTTKRWHGITIIRPKGSGYQINNVSIENCNIRNIKGRGVNMGGYKIETNKPLETKYADNRIVGEAIWDIVRASLDEKITKYDEYIANGILTGYEDICEREWYIRKTINNIKIEGCNISNTSGGIIQNVTYGTKIINNRISDSYDATRTPRGIENITIDFSDNCLCMGNILSGSFGGCANIGTGACDNCIIKDNIIDNSGYNRVNQKFNVGISHQSISGMSKNYIVAGNYITNANCAIWIKDNRYKISNQYAGSRGGEKFYIVNNKIENYQECGIRVSGVMGTSYVTGNECESIILPENNTYVQFSLAQDQTKPQVEIIGNIDNNQVYSFGDWVNQNVRLTVNAEGTSGIFKYSFDGGNTWKYSNETNSNIYEVCESKDISVVVMDTAENESRTDLQVKIDKDKPIINSVTGNPEEYTKQNVTLVVNAIDTDSGVAEYSFDGGKTWQAENSKEYSENTKGIVIKVKDKAGNESTYDETINITNINKVKGDINGDYKTNIIDLLLMKRHILSGSKEKWKLTGFKFEKADLNSDGKINIIDLLLLKRIILRAR